MRNPFTVLKSAVSSLFKGSKPSAPVYVPRAKEPEPDLDLSLDSEDREVLRAFREAGRTLPPDPRGYIPTQRARNQRRKARADVRSFVRMLNQGREDHGL